MTLILISIVKALIAWFVLTYLGTNLVGMIGRGFLEKPLDINEHPDFLKNEVKKWNRAGKLTTVLSIVATVGISFFIYQWWGILFLIAIILVMISRIPDLYWEVCILPKKLGVPYPVPKDLIRKAIKSQNRGMQNILLASLTWIALVVLFIGFFTQ
ncbi:MAG: hypothetical protein US18_C0027G0016 [Parcubacteria group bacterium GW2011_GWB1_36_5]|nr:MAG: hypothetical protein US18_C0027G0016 [Parcubacteria group bacterium GW2011_GWB1_36_5]